MKERIIEETTRLFAQRGIKSIRMDDIAAALSVSKRTIYELFSDKETLIVECLRHFNCQIQLRNAETVRGAGNIIEEFVMMMEVWDRQAEVTYNLMTDVRKFYPKLHEEYIKAHIKTTQARLREKLQRGVDQGYLLDSVDLNLAISVLGYSVFGVLRHDAFLPANVTERDVFKYITTYFLRGIATRKGIDLIDLYFKKKKRTTA